MDHDLAHHSGAIWSPLGLVVPPASETYAKPNRRRVPGVFKNLVGMVLLVGLVLLVLGIVIAPLLFWGFGMVFVAGFTMVAISMLERSEQMTLWLFSELARDKGWRFRRAIPPEPESTGGKKARQTWRQVDPATIALHAQLEPLMRVHPGYLFPFEPQGYFWGETQDGLPFFLSLSLIEIQAAMASESIRQDQHGNRSSNGHMVQMLMAYPLGADTGVEAFLRSEFLNRNSRRGYQAESIDFNRRFELRMIAGEELDLVRAISPATQTAMIDLADRYQVQFLLRRDVIWVMGHDRIMQPDLSTLGDLMPKILREFSVGVSDFRKYLGG